jgi:cell division protease FtsH
LVDEAGTTARKILQECRDDLEKVAIALLEYETLSGEEVKALLRGEPVVRPDHDDEPKDTGRRASVPSSGKKKDHPHGGLEAEPQPGG